MATLVSPGYKNSTLVNRILYPADERIIEFAGLNVQTYHADGEMPDMKNLTADKYPVLSVRRPRGQYKLDGTGCVKPLQILSRHEKLAIIGTDENGDVWFWYDRVKITAVTRLTSASRMVAINTKICFFPDKTYIEIKQDGTVGEFGQLECSKTASGLAVTVSNEDARVEFNEELDFSYDDAINMVGTLTYTASGTTKQAECNVSCILEQVIKTDSPANTTLVMPRETFIELTGEGATNRTFTGSISRGLPLDADNNPVDLDFVIEWNNRLWGASNKENTIFACKLGDPKNWQYFQGTGLDSYYAAQGTDGHWTGVGAYSGHLLFFKPNGICRIYGTSPSNYQVTNTKAFGVEEGSSLSVVTINDVVYYKSAIGIMAYSGGAPVLISEKIGDDFCNVVAGSEGTKYYASIQRKYGSGSIELLVYDIAKGTWHKEDGLRFHSSCTINNSLHVVTYTDPEDWICAENLVMFEGMLLGKDEARGEITIINPVDTTENPDNIDWMAEFGPFHEYLENRKIYSRLLLRLKANKPSSVNVSILIDEKRKIDDPNEYDWQPVQTYTPAVTEGQMIPIIPVRCDRYSIKIEGKGDCEILSLTRKVRQGSHGKL